MKKIPLFPAFKTLELTDREEIEEITKLYLPYSEYHFPLMWIWDTNEQVKVSFLHDNLIVLQPETLTGKLFYSLFGNNQIPATISHLTNYIKENNLQTTIKFIPEETFQAANEQSDLFIEDQDNHDYIYEVKSLHLASGSQYSNYRSQIKRFLAKNKDFEIKFVNIHDEECHTELIELFKGWLNAKNEDQNFGEAPLELHAFKKLLQTVQNFLSFKVLGLYIQEEMIAFAVIDTMNSEYACIPFFKSNIAYTCSAQFLLKSVVSHLHDNCIKYINFEPDLGISALRFTKQSYRPIKLLKKYSIEIAD